MGGAYVNHVFPLFSVVAARIIIHYTTHGIHNTIAMASDDLGEDEVLMLLGATACVHHCM
jgi:hypothetical protein